MTEIIDKIRALVSDLQKTTYQTFIYVTSSVFKIATPNATATSVLVNGSASGVLYTYDADSQEVTISSSLSAGDVILINFSYYSYSETEIKAYIKSALVYLSIHSYTADEDYEVEGDEIYPIPSNKDEDIISLIASILIKPNYSHYSTATVTVRYPKSVDKDTKIESLLQRIRWGLGSIKCITFD